MSWNLYTLFSVAMAAGATVEVAVALAIWRRRRPLVLWGPVAFLLSNPALGPGLLFALVMVFVAPVPFWMRAFLTVVVLAFVLMFVLGRGWHVLGVTPDAVRMALQPSLAPDVGLRTGEVDQTVELASGAKLRVVASLWRRTAYLGPVQWSSARELAPVIVVISQRLADARAGVLPVNQLVLGLVMFAIAFSTLLRTVG